MPVELLPVIKEGRSRHHPDGTKQQQKMHY